MGLAHVEFIFDVERAFDITIPDADAVKIETPRQLVAYLLTHIQRPGSEEGGVSWTETEVEQVVEGLILEDMDVKGVTFTFDTPFRDLFV